MEVVLVTSSKDSGVIAMDLQSGVASTFKDCVAEAGTLVNLSGMNSFSGCGSAGDYIAVAQAKKPVIHVWQWDKPQVLLHCHEQEILTSLCSDSANGLLLGGSKSGRVYIWEIGSGQLLYMWQAHFKTISRTRVSPRGDWLITASEDGVIKAWNYLSVFHDSTRLSSAASLQPYRSWTAHTLPVKDLSLLGCMPSSLRVLSCSLDRHIALYDIASSRICLKVLCPVPLECIVASHTLDCCFAGGNDGNIVIFDLSVAAVSLSAAHAAVLRSDRSLTNNPATSSDATAISLLSGHSRAVTALALSLDNRTLVSGSEDGSLRIWDIVSRQCVKELSPTHKHPITNLLIIVRPELLSSGTGTKSTILPIAPFKKYADTQQQNSSSTNQTAPEVVNSRYVGSKLSLGYTSAPQKESEFLFEMKTGLNTLLYTASNTKLPSSHVANSTAAVGALSGEYIRMSNNQDSVFTSLSSTNSRKQNIARLLREEKDEQKSINPVIAETTVSAVDDDLPDAQPSTSKKTNRKEKRGVEMEIGNSGSNISKKKTISSNLSVKQLRKMSTTKQQ